MVGINRSRGEELWVCLPGEGCRAKGRRSRRGPTGPWCCRCLRGRSTRSSPRTWRPRRRQACYQQDRSSIASIAFDEKGKGIVPEVGARGDAAGGLECELVAVEGAPCEALHGHRLHGRDRGEGGHCCVLRVVLLLRFRGLRSLPHVAAARIFIRSPISTRLW